MKSGVKAWIGFGSVFVAAAIILSSISDTAAGLIWVAQIATAFALKRSYLVRTYPKDLPMPDDIKTFKAIAAHRPKIDINSCSKNDLVNGLGLPIVYANDIESLRSEGHIFTSIEELHDILEVPTTTLQKIEPMVVFSYDYRQDAAYSWKRVNHMSSEELTDLGIAPQIALQIIRERQQRGEFKSLMDIKKRTGIPFNAYRQLA
jgi:DNA uptake protein ComE-like DNA-binding protein